MFKSIYKKKTNKQKQNLNFLFLISYLPGKDRAKSA